MPTQAQVQARTRNWKLYRIKGLAALVGSARHQGFSPKATLLFEDAYCALLDAVYEQEKFNKGESK